MTADHHPCLSAEDVTLVRDDRRILDGVSLSVVAGRLTVVIGPNGAGKSSLLAVLSGLWAPDRGRVLLEGRGIGEYSPAARARRCAVMRQDHTRPAGLTVLEAVELGRLSGQGGGGEAQAVAWAMLRRMELEELATRDCTRLSGGEWQRVAFARTLAQIWETGHPATLLLDEPVSSLDPAHQHQLLGQARRLARDGHAVLVILHDLNLTAGYADEVALLREGRLLSCGPAAEMMTPDRLSVIYGCRVVSVESAGSGVRGFVSLPPEGVE
jgi:iron complex transport system ATP-binding protein